MTAVPDPEDEMLAAELAFGLLDAPARAGAETRCASDRSFEALCGTWRSYAAGFFDEAEVLPDAAIWASIQRRLPANDEVAATAALRRAVRAWRATSAALAVVALAATGFALLRPQPAPVVQRVPIAATPTIVLLTGASNVGVMAVSYDRAAGRIAATSSGLAIGPHAAELWVIPGDGKPRSLGVVRANAADARIEPADLRGLIAAGATLAISVEPTGGSPTGQPTGPVILSGKVTTS